MPSDLSDHFNQPFHDLSPAIGSGAKHLFEGGLQLGLGAGLAIESGGMLGFLEGGALFGLISGGLVNVGIGISEIAAGIEGTPIDAEAMETGLTIAKSPLNVGLVAAGTAAGLSAKQAASAEEMFETGMCVKEISEGSEELEKLLSVVSFFGNKLFGTGEVEGGNEGNENADDTDSDEEGDGSGDASDDGGSGEDRNQDGKPRDE